MRIFVLCQCADYVRASYAGAGEAHVARVTFGEKFGVCTQARCAIIPDLHLHRQRTPSSTSLSE